MIIGIFGDSFADSSNGGAKDEQKTSWPELLARKYEVHNRACSGSGAKWAVEEVLRYFSKYDKIVITFSSLDRYYINPMWHHKLKGLKPIYKHIRPGSDVPQPKNSFFQSAFNVAQEYYKFFENSRFSDNDSAAYCLLLKHLGDKVLPLKNRIDTYPQELANIKWSNEMGLSEIFNYENKLLFGTQEYTGEHHFNDRRSCHITAWHHKMLYNKIVKWIEGNDFNLTTDDLLDLDPQQIKDRYYGNW